jgi:hypothetical protein
LLVG